MITIGVTGAEGLIGFHLRAFLYGTKDVSLRVATRPTLSDRKALLSFVDGCDAIVHLAGLNRASDDEILKTNSELTANLISAMEGSGAKPLVLFSSSTHIDRDTAYGRSKRECAEALTGWADRSGGSFCNLILPHVFGEFGKPFYNSVVSTFCYQLSKGEEPTIVQDGQLELLHAQQVSTSVCELIKKRTTGKVRLPGRAIKVSELLTTLRAMDVLYRSQQVPDVRDEFALLLFNTYRSYLYPTHYPVALKLHSDNRGSLFEAVKSENGGQSFLSSTHPNITRGNHYHRRKIERFLVVKGQAVIRLRKLFTDEVREFAVSGDKPVFIDIPTLHTHNITNTGDDELTTLFWSHEIFNPEQPDTFAENV